jgi:hypothetical protein
LARRVRRACLERRGRRCGATAQLSRDVHSQPLDEPASISMPSKSGRRFVDHDRREPTRGPAGRECARIGRVCSDLVSKRAATGSLPIRHARPPSSLGFPGPSSVCGDAHQANPVWKHLTSNLLERLAEEPFDTYLRMCGFNAATMSLSCSG